MGEPARVVIADPDQVFRGEVEKVLKGTGGFLVQEASELGETVLAKVEARIPSVLLLGPNFEVESVLAFAGTVALERPFVSVLLATQNLDTTILQRALRAGIKDVLQVPLKKEALVASVEAAVRFSSSVLGAIVPVTDRREGARGRGRVVTVFSTKGGVGKTVVATNLAVALALHGHRTIIVDLDLKFGDVAVMLKLTPDHSVYDAVQAGERLDAEMLDGLLATHRESGLKALLAPVDPELAEAIREKQVIDVIDYLRTVADFVVVDTPASIDKVILGVVDDSDEVLLIATMDVPSVKNAKVAHGILKMLNVPASRVKLVLNRADSKVGLSIGDVEKAVGARVFLTVPSDRVVPRSVNLGVPVVINAPRSEVSRSFDSLARLIAQQHNRAAATA